ncbi:MAG: hypothetical protein ABI599_04220 [Flavobacteriales bacterium]
MQHTRTLLLLSSTLLGAALAAQQPNDRFLPVVVDVLVNGEAGEQFTVTLFRDNEEVTRLLPSKHSAFQFALDLNAYYAIRITKEGFREKLVYVDSHLPEGVEKYDAYQCVVALETADRFAYSNPFYLDFPSALVRWDATKHSYDHSDEYLDDIQLKIALLSAQSETE